MIDILSRITETTIFEDNSIETKAFYLPKK